MVPRGEKWQPNPVFLLGKSHGPRSLVGYSPWNHKESDTTDGLHMHPLVSIYPTDASLVLPTEIIKNDFRYC